VNIFRPAVFLSSIPTRPDHKSVGIRAFSGHLVSELMPALKTAISPQKNRRPPGHGIAVINGRLIPGDPDQPTCIDLKPVREEER
jgi:hypothetical protein